MILRSGFLVLALGLTACGASRHCERVQPYQDAETLPPLQSVDGLTPPTSPSALQIPAAPAQPVAFSVEEADPRRPERTRMRCLDMPPPLPERHLAVPEEN